MPRITRVYTRTGDDGTTALGSGERLRKDAPRVAAYGDVDELNCRVGAALAAGLDEVTATALGAVQNELFHLGAELCVSEEGRAERPGPRIEQRHVDRLESLIDELSEGLPPLENFVLPGGSEAAARLHVARAVCRRAERSLVTLAGAEQVAPEPMTYLNRLSDLLFVMARYENRRRAVDDVLWNSRA